MDNKKCVLQITEAMLQAANISPKAGQMVNSLHKAVVITETDVLEYVPDELLDLFDAFGISENAVRNVLLQDNGILEALAAMET